METIIQRKSSFPSHITQPLRSLAFLVIYMLLYLLELYAFKKKSYDICGEFFFKRVCTSLYI